MDTHTNNKYPILILKGDKQPCFLFLKLYFIVTPILLLFCIYEGICNFSSAIILSVINFGILNLIMYAFSRSQMEELSRYYILVFGVFEILLGVCLLSMITTIDTNPLNFSGLPLFSFLSGIALFDLVVFITRKKNWTSIYMLTFVKWLVVLLCFTVITFFLDADFFKSFNSCSLFIATLLNALFIFTLCYNQDNELEKTMISNNPVNDNQLV